MKETLNIYKCLCDETRLRILNLLHHGPLCVCHIQEILGETQVKVSKQLAYMKRLGLVVVTRNANWRIYQIPEPATPLLIENLKYLQDLKAEGSVFRSDLKKLNKIDTSAACLPEEACSPSCK
jgi:ArsR family transcriptional regulator